MKIVFEYDGVDLITQTWTDQTIDNLVTTAENLADDNNAELEEINIRFETGKISTDNDIYAVIEEVNRRNSL